MTSTPTRPVDNVVIATKGLQDRNINILAGTIVKSSHRCKNMIFFSIKFYLIRLIFTSLLVKMLCYTCVILTRNDGDINLIQDYVGFS